MKPAPLNFPMPIMTPRLILRPPQLGDEAMLNAAIIESYDDIRQTMPWAKEKPSLEQTKEFVRQASYNWIDKKNEEPYLPLVILDNTNRQLIGMTGYHHLNWEVPCLETGYWIKTTLSGKGFITEAINALTQYAFKQLNVKRIAITCDVANLKSKKIPERLGYTLEAILKNNRITPSTGEVSDTLVFAKYDLSDLPSLQIKWD